MRTQPLMAIRESRPAPFSARRPPGAARLWAVPLTLVVCAPIAAQEPLTPSRPPSNARMAERLESAAAVRDSRLDNIYANASRLEVLLGLPPPTGRTERLVYRGAVATEMLNAGRTAEAVDAFEQLHQLLQANGDPPGDLPVGFRDSMRRSRGIAHLQRAQRENCFPPRPAARCVMPVDAAAVHADRDGTRRAIALYEQMAADDPADIVARWVLNLGRMWAGEYPAGVPPALRIPRSAFGSSTGIGRFVDVAPKLGLDTVSRSGGSVMEDFDGDGDLDLMASSSGLRDQLRVFRNNGDGTFDDATVEAGLEGIVGGLNLVPADYDNDGHADVLVLRGAWSNRPHPNSLLRSNGDGSFTDVTEAAGLLRGAPTQTAAWGDYDNDGDVDLFVGNESELSLTYSYPSQLFRNNGDGTFSDVAYLAGVQVVGFVKGAAWGDYDNDGRLDLYLSRLEEPNHLFRNEGPSPDGQWSFREVTAAAGVEAPLNSFPTWFFDYDNDGWLDLYVAGFRDAVGDIVAEYLGERRPAGHPVLYRNRGDGTFADVTAVVGLARSMPTMGSNYGDLDNDGFQDIYLGTGSPYLEMLVPNRVFRNAGGARFEEVTTAGGFGHIQKGHGVSFGDIDHDGDQDVFMVLGGAFEGDLSQNVLLLNPGRGNAWITLRLRGTASNRLGIGARIMVEVEAPDGDRVIHATAGSGGSFGASTLQQEIGLGAATRIRALTVVWPGSGRRDTHRDVPLNRVVLVREGETAVETVPVQPLDLD